MLARHNPFATDRIERLLKFQPAWSATTWQKLDQQWTSLGRRATITGAHGTGKTCFLSAWADRIACQTQQAPVRIFLNRDQPRISSPQWQALSHCQNQAVLLDGEEQLGLRARHKFYRLTQHASSILVTRHAPGRLPTLIHLNPDIETLTRCVHQLASDYLEQLSPLLPALWQKHNGNIRHILLACYDQLASEKPQVEPV